MILLIGLDNPFNRLIESSEFNPTTNISPCFFENLSNLI